MRTIYHNWILDRLCEAFGDAPVEAIVQAFGGRAAIIPMKPNQRWVDLLGADAAAWLCEHHGDHSFSVPTKAALARRRDQAARKLAIQTSQESTAALAKRFQLSTRQIRNIKAQRRDPRLT